MSYQTQILMYGSVSPFQNSTVSASAALATCSSQDRFLYQLDDRDVCMAGWDVSQSRLIEDNGRVELVPATPFYMIGQNVVRPLIDATTSFVSKIGTCARRSLKALLGEQNSATFSCETEISSDVSSGARVAPREIVYFGSRTFYEQKDYAEQARADFERKTPPLPSCVYQSPKGALSTSLIDNPLHARLGDLLLSPTDSRRIANVARPLISLDTEWKFRRFSLLVDGYRVDAMLMGRNSTLGNGRWLLNTLGRSGFYECHVISNPEIVNPKHASYLPCMRSLLSQLGANVVYYNYPGVGVSEGPISRPMMNKAHEAFLRFLEDGVHAREIIDYGHSIGGIDQGDAWASHIPHEGVKYVLVKDRTFKTLSGMISATQGRMAGYMSWALGWNMDSLESSRTTPFPEVHVVSVKAESSQRLLDQSSVVYGDARIPVDESLGMEFFRSPLSANGRKVFIGVPAAHEAPIQDPTPLAKAINEAFAAQSHDKSL